MAKRTYVELVQEIETLKAEAERLRAEEVDGVIARIREAIATYGLTSADLFGKRIPSSRQQKKRASAPMAGTPKKTIGVRYADGHGNSWGGRGPRPGWLRDALERGEVLESFRKAA